MSLPVYCSECAAVVYRLEPVEGSLPRLVASDLGPPIVVTVSDRRRYVFCSRECLLWTFAGLTDEELRGGYPLGLSVAGEG